MTGLPPGWTLQRVQTLEPASELLDPSDHDVFFSDGRTLEELKPECIISFSGLCLVRVTGDSEWYMGDLGDLGGSIVCWSSYGSDLERAIHAL